MDIQRLIALNRYTRRDIKNLTGATVESSVVCIGNILERRRMSENIRARIPFALVGPQQSGKYTSVIAVCDELDVEHRDCYDATGFGNSPFTDGESVFIMRNPKKDKLVKSYVEGGCMVVLLFDEKPAITNIDTIPITPPTSVQIKKYEEIKGSPMLRHISPSKKEVEKVLVAKSLRRGISESEMPDTTHRWLSCNFYTSTKMLELSDLAQRQKDKTIYWALMNQVRYKRSKNLNYPVWVKRT